MSEAHPNEWAKGKRSKAKRYAEGEVAAHLRAAIPVLSPGVPVAAWIGVACNGSMNENTTGWITCNDAERAEAERTGKTPLGRALGDYARTGLHELGPLGVEAGRAPHTVPSDDSPWCSGARAPAVSLILGRGGVTDPGAWHGAIADQVVIGVYNNVAHGRKTRRLLDGGLQWEVGADGNPVLWSLWPFAVATMAWSAGNSGAARHINRFVEALAATPESKRWGEFVRLASTFSGEGHKHKRPSYSALRTCQKLAAAALAAGWTGESGAALEWLDDGLGDDRAQVFEVLVSSAAL